MVRNIVLMVSTLAIMGVLFGAYVLLVEDPAPRPEQEQAAIDVLPVEQHEPSESLRLGGAVDVPPGEAVEFTVYDDQTGEPTQHFRCAEWTPAGDHEVTVEGPVLTIWLPNDATARIAADEGRIVVEDKPGMQNRPRRGSLSGNVRIVVVREVIDADTPVDALPADAVRVELEELRFDVGLGTLAADGRVAVFGPEFELIGSGLDAVWNEAENVVESLEIREGHHLVLRGATQLFGGGSAPRDAAANASSTTTRPEPSAAQRYAQSYTCLLTGGVVAEQFEGAERVGRLDADEFQLRFDVGRTAGLMRRDEPRSGPAPATQPGEAPVEDPTATQPAAPGRERLVVRWHGPLLLTSSGQTPVGEAGLRRHFEASGAPLRLAQDDRALECGRLVYHEETEQAWLHPSAGRRVRFAIGEGRRASASSVYLNLRAGVIKLIGEVEVEVAAGPQEPDRRVFCSLWAELHLSRKSAGARKAAVPAEDPMMGGTQLERAVFVGDVNVEHAGEALTAHRLDVTFQQGGRDGGEGLTLDTAQAYGAVRLAGEEEALECARLHLEFALDASGEVYPVSMDAVGSVVIARGRSWLRGRHVLATLRAVSTDASRRGPAFALRTLDVTGDAVLYHPEERIGARGDRISAEFSDENRFDKGIVLGSREEHALVQAESYRVYGERIELAWAARTLHVEGPALLKFDTNRTLQGDRTRGRKTVTVACEDSLHIDALERNSVHFAGNVRAESGDEQLKAATLTLLMRNVDEPPMPKRQRARVLELLAQARRALDADSGQEPGWLGVPAQEENLRREPVRLIAEDALVQREIYPDADGGAPRVHMSIRSPLLEVDILHREIVSHGTTDLLVTNEVEQAASEGRDGAAFGVPSALVTRGPSQTALQCDGSMIYALGDQAEQQQDAVLFEGGVFFRHVAGAAIIRPGMPAQAEPDAASADGDTRDTTMTCDRLECGFVRSGMGDVAEASGGGMQLMWLLASGSAHLRDDQDPVIREVHATQLDFDRRLGLVRVLGMPLAPARIYEENRESVDSRILVGDEFIINLRDNTVRTGATRGEFAEQ